MSGNRVLLYHPVHLPPRDYGGTERVVLWLAQGLRDLGASVAVACSPTSRLPQGIDYFDVQKSDWLARAAAKFDVIHFHAPIPKREWESILMPKLVTIHGNGQPGELFSKNTIFLSKDHAIRHHAECFVYNGLDLAEYPLSHRHEDWFLFLSKTSWRIKNLKGALSLCQKAQVRLKVAGGNRPFLERAWCFLDPRLQWLGPVNGRLKMEALGLAKALLFPVLWPEPFGLVMIEAMACGTPVFASDTGSTPEIIDSKTGRLLKSEEEWLNILSDRQLKFDPLDCRSHVAERFNHHLMAENYLSLYKKVIDGQSLNQDRPYV